MGDNLTVKELAAKLENYCAYQERCHRDVREKLRSLGARQHDVDLVIGHLIQANYLNEERFARNFARGKFRIKGWGRNRIVSELKARNITAPNIRAALSELETEDYEGRFDEIAQKHWESIAENHPLKKKKKFTDYLLRKGYEPELIQEAAERLSAEEGNL